MKRKELFKVVRWRKPSKCTNCNKLGQHFVPPSLGEEGFYICGPAEAI